MRRQPENQKNLYTSATKRKIDNKKETQLQLQKNTEALIRASEFLIAIQEPGLIKTVIDYLFATKVTIFNLSKRPKLPSYLLKLHSSLQVTQSLTNTPPTNNDDEKNDKNKSLMN